MLTYYAAICLELHHLNSNTNLIKHWHNDYSYQLVMPWKMTQELFSVPFYIGVKAQMGKTSKICNAALLGQPWIRQVWLMTTTVNNKTTTA